MSGGSLNYLCYAEPTEIFNKIKEIEAVEKELIKYNYIDIAKDARRLIEYVLTCENRITVLKEQLNPIFRAVEWHTSADIGKDSMIATFENYRNSIYKNREENEQ